MKLSDFVCVRISQKHWCNRDEENLMENIEEVKITHTGSTIDVGHG
jgi:hypothetical protein